MVKFTKKFNRKLKRAFRGKRKARGASAGVRALRAVKKIQRKVEYKYFDGAFGADEPLINGGTTFPLLTGLEQGVEAQNRVGLDVNLARLHIRGSIRIDSTSVAATGATQMYRIMIVRGIRENGNVPVMRTSTSPTLGVLEATGSIDTMYARKELNNMRDTKILYDKVLTLTPGQQTLRMINWNFKLGWKCQFKRGDTSVEDGGLYLLMAGGVDGALVARIDARVTFSET